mmetsp:Transcript_61592/g.159898  ORF Transcript_61592/g.159898 Transcript_61592/m.159898 type:complete len:175 (-) Transcript_61592:2000-2524(-)
MAPVESRELWQRWSAALPPRFFAALVDEVVSRRLVLAAKGGLLVKPSPLAERRPKALPLQRPVALADEAVSQRPALVARAVVPTGPDPKALPRGLAPLVHGAVLRRLALAARVALLAGLTLVNEAWWVPQQQRGALGETVPQVEGLLGRRSAAVGAWAYTQEQVQLQPGPTWRA